MSFVQNRESNQASSWESSKETQGVPGYQSYSSQTFVTAEEKSESSYLVTCFYE